MAQLPEKDYQSDFNESFNKHVAGKLRKQYPEISSATDDELLQVWQKLEIPDASPDETHKVLTKLYAEDWEPPKDSFVRKTGDALKVAGEIGTDVAKGIATFAGPAHLGAMAGKGLRGTAVGQLALAGVHATNLAGQLAAGSSTVKLPFIKEFDLPQVPGLAKPMEQTAKDIPVPNIEEMRAKGYTEAQIHNVMKGYTDTQQSLMSDVEQTGREGVSEAASAIADSAFLGVGGNQISKLVQKAGGGSALEHGLTGAVIGGGYGATQSATERGAQAIADGKRADQILGEMTSGALAGGAMGIAAGGILGGAIGGIIGKVAAKSAARQAATAKAINDALSVRLKSFGEDFKPQWLIERFKDDFKLANEQGLPDEALAINIVKNVYSPEVAASEEGMRAASNIFEKVKAWRVVNEGLAGPMVNLPTQSIEGPLPRPGQPQLPGLEGNRPASPPGGEVPVNEPPAVQGPIGQPPPRATAPEGTSQIEGLEKTPPVTQQEVPMQLEGNAPEQPNVRRLTQPLVSETAPNVNSSLLVPHEGDPNLKRNLVSVPPERTAPPKSDLTFRDLEEVPVRNVGGGPEDFGNRDLSPKEPVPPTIQKWMDQAAKAEAAGDKTKAEKLKKRIEKAKEGLKEQKIVKLTFNRENARPAYISPEHSLTTDEIPEKEMKAIKKHILSTSFSKAALWFAKNAPDKNTKLISARLAAMLRQMENEGAAKGSFDYVKSRNLPYASYNAEKGKIIINEYYGGEQTVLHELAHAATENRVHRGLPADASAKEIEQFQEAIAEMVDLHEHLLSQKSPKRDMVRYGLSATNELFVEGLVNPELQAWMETVKYGKTTAWPHFVQATRKLLGFPPSANTALSHYLRIVDKILKIEDSSSPEAVTRKLLREIRENNF